MMQRARETAPAATLPWALVALLAIGIAAYAVLGMFGVMPLAPFVATSAYPRLFVLHMAGGAVAMLLGPWQFRPGWRGARSATHRWVGRLYLGAVLVSGLSGLWLAPAAQTGTVAALGFGGLAIAWLVTGGMAYVTVRDRRFQEHRRWMVRNFALTMAAATLRLWLPGSIMAGIPYEPAYATVAWLCWVPNLAAAEWWLRRRPKRAVAMEG